MKLLETQLPAGWTWERISDRYRITKRPRDLKLAELKSIPFVPMEAVPSNGYENVRFEMRSPSQIASGTYFEKGDILLSKITPSFENGKQGLAGNIPATFGMASTEIIPLQPLDDRSERRFLFYYLLHPEIRTILAGKMEGSTGRQRVPEHVVRDFNFPVPPKSEQEKIAAALWKVQHAIETEEQLIAVARELKQSVMGQLFTSGLRGEAQKETRVGWIPESWTLIPSSEIFKLTSGDKRPADLSTVATADKPFPVLGGNGVMGFSAEWFLDTKECIVIGRVGEYCGAIHLAHGKVWVTDNALYAKEWLRDDVRVDFLAFFLDYYDLNRFKRKAGQPLVTQGLINEHSFPIPSPSEQFDIATILKTIDRKISVLEQKRATLQELFKTMLHQLMTGEIRVADLDIDVSEIKS